MLHYRALRTLIPRTQLSRTTRRYIGGKISDDKRMQSLRESIARQPALAAQLEKIGHMLQQKGMVQGKLTALQMLRIVFDREIKLELHAFKQELKRAGISLGPEQMGPLLSVLGLQRKP